MNKSLITINPFLTDIPIFDTKCLLFTFESYSGLADRTSATYVVGTRFQYDHGWYNQLLTNWQWRIYGEGRTLPAPYRRKTYGAQP